MLYPPIFSPSFAGMHHLPDALLTHFKEYIPVSETLREALATRLQEKTFRKGQLVHDAANVCTKSYFIAEGMLRVFFYQRR